VAIKPNENYVIKIILKTLKWIYAKNDQTKHILKIRKVEY